jgi:hypothetical protein
MVDTRSAGSQFFNKRRKPLERTDRIFHFLTRQYVGETPGTLRSAR